MRQLVKRPLICLLIGLLLLLSRCSPSTAKTADVQRVQDGYLLSEQAMRDTVAGWTADRESARVLRQGMDELRAEIAAQAEDTRRLVSDLKRELERERAAYNAKIRRAKGQGLLYGVLIGSIGIMIAK
ncbi:chemotaxis protein [Pyramidobacter piscolens]|uniref:chemotaxis protein n=1 Tax=Pyramidobacter piscolens TaxID=638849 RepID=UPI00266BF853|nr:chemotaxis protein [Pyramidobacter piscolens]